MIPPEPSRAGNLRVWNLEDDDAMDRTFPALRHGPDPRARCLASGFAGATRPERPSAALRATIAAAVAVSLAGCAAVRPATRPYPTLAQYSDGASTLASAVSSALYSRDKAALEKLWSAGATVRLATAPSAPEFESPSSLKIERFAAAPSAVSRDDALRALLERREAFIGVVHDDTRLIGASARGDRREIRIHRRFAGPAHDGPRQEESWWTWQIVRRPDTPAGWEITSAVEERRVAVTAHQPLFRQVYPEDGAPNWKASTTRADARRSLAVPGLHDTGGVAVLNDCIDRKPCLLIGGGEGIAALVAGDEYEYENRATLLRLGAITGEVKSILAGDFDNNGLPDLLVTFDRAPARILQGQRYLQPGGENEERMEYLAFQEATQGSGLEGLIGPLRSAVALDADRDGRLDLYVVEYGDTTKTGPSIDGRNGQPNHLFRNVTEPGSPIRFEEIGRASGTDDTGWGLAAAAADYDGDGRMDLFVANDFGRDVLYRNVTPAKGAIRFEDVTHRAQVEDAGGSGACWGDYDGDGDLDLFVSRDGFDERWILADPSFPRPAERGVAARLTRALSERLRGGVLYRNEVATSGRFTRVSDSAGVADAGWAWGAAWLDADGDGRLDLAVANGMLSGKGGAGREIDLWNETSAGWADYSKGDWKIDFGEDGITGPQAERLFINLGDGTFADAGYVGGFDTTADLRGLVAADITADAAPDLVGAAFLDSPVIYQNTNAGNPGRVRVRLEGTGSNWDAAGAIVKLTAGGRTQTRVVAAGGSFLSDGGRYVDFGYGTAGEIDTVEVIWPSGLRSVLDKPTADRRTIDVTEPASPGGLPPPATGKP